MIELNLVVLPVSRETDLLYDPKRSSAIVQSKEWQPVVIHHRSRISSPMVRQFGIMIENLFLTMDWYLSFVYGGEI